jgi:hypothetical protein
MMAGATRSVFLSYRRAKTRHIAGRLADWLTARLKRGQVFMDVETIEPGTDFAAVIARAVASCRVLIAMIGPTWATTTDQHGRRRLDDHDDFVVLEIQTALERGIPVIPVLVDGAKMPERGDLPEALQGLTRCQAVRLDHDTFLSDVTVLHNAVKRILSTPASPDHQPTRPIVHRSNDSSHVRKFYAVIIILASIIFGTTVVIGLSLNAENARTASDGISATITIVVALIATAYGFTSYFTKRDIFWRSRLGTHGVISSKKRGSNKLITLGKILWVTLLALTSTVLFGAVLVGLLYTFSGVYEGSGRVGSLVVAILFGATLYGCLFLLVKALQRQ